MEIKKRLLGVLLLPCLIAIQGCEVSEPLTLTIASVNDTHSHFDEDVMQLTLPNESNELTPTYSYVGGFPRLKTKINNIRSQVDLTEDELLVLHAGDAFTGSLFFTKYQGQLNAEFMNDIGFDAMAIGNHEFDLGNEKLRDFINATNFPLLSANVEVGNKDPIYKRFYRYKIFVKADQPVAVVGLTTEFTEIISNPSTDTVFKEVVEQSHQVVEELTGLGVNKIIFLTHIGHDNDIELARQVSGIDVIIGGHSSELLGDHTNIGLGNNGHSPTLVENPNGETICVMQSGDFTRAVGVTNVTFDELGKLESCDANNVLMVGDIFVQGNPPAPVEPQTQENIAAYIALQNNIEILDKDPEMQERLDIAKQEVEEFSNTVVGVSSSPLYHVYLPGDEHPVEGVINEGSMVAPHIANSMTWKMSQTSGEQHIGIINAGGVRADLSGDFTVGDAYTVVPFNNTLVTMTVSGDSLVNTLQVSAANAFLISGVALPYVSNLKYDVNLTDPTSPTVENVRVNDGTGNFIAVNTSAEYKLVTNAYLAGGGDLYQFNNAANIVDTGLVDADVLIQYVANSPSSTIQPIDNGIFIIR